MVSYFCDCCQFTTNKIRIYHDHLASNSHVVAFNQKSVPIPEPAAVIKGEEEEEKKTTMEELERALESKELEIGYLKMQLRIKEDVITLLKKHKS